MRRRLPGFVEVQMHDVTRCAAHKAVIEVVQNRAPLQFVVRCTPILLIERIGFEHKRAADHVIDEIILVNLFQKVLILGVIREVQVLGGIEDFFEVNSYARLSQIEDSIKSVDPYLTTTGVSASEATYYLVFLHLPVNEELPEKAVEEIEEMYNAVDFTNFGFRNIMFTLGEENDKEKERARFIFEKDYSEKDVDLVIIFKNGRYEKYRDQLDDIIQQDSFFEQFDITWN